MPIYEYRCTGCSILIEKISRVEVQELICPHCGEKARRIVSICAAQASDSGGSSTFGPTCRPASGYS